MLTKAIGLVRLHTHLGFQKKKGDENGILRRWDVTQRGRSAFGNHADELWRMWDVALMVVGRATWMWRKYYVAHVAFCARKLLHEYYEPELNTFAIWCRYIQ